MLHTITILKVARKNPQTTNGDLIISTVDFRPWQALIVYSKMAESKSLKSKVFEFFILVENAESVLIFVVSFGVKCSAVETLLLFGK